jgi:hypothetical protein
VSSLFPRHVWALFATYVAASIAHFVHNAEFIALYPNMPAWLTREGVYLAWLAISSVGLAGIVAARFGFRALGALLVGAYGGCGLNGLGHYALALCSEHTLVSNVTIWVEAAVGLMLALAAVLNSARWARAGVGAWRLSP